MDFLFNDEYYTSCCGEDYHNKSHWENFFGSIAEKIVADFKPKTVLDAGCAWGYLVAALRDRGVEAYGIDISEFAISKVRNDIKPYCEVCSLTEPLPDGFPQKFDLVTNIEVLEHLYEEDGLKALENFCGYTERVIFSSTPDDITEKTHFNVQQPEYWIKRFARHSFYNDVNYTPDYISNAALCLYKTGDFAKIAENYERNRRLLSYDVREFAKIKRCGDCVIYIDTGDGFNETQKVIQPLNLDNCKFTLILGLNDFGCSVRAVRFDPIEGKACLLKDLEAVTNNGAINYTSINGISEGGLLVFKNTDAQILFVLESQEHIFLKITGELYSFETDAVALTSRIEEFAVSHGTLEDALEELKQSNAETDKLKIFIENMESEKEWLESVINDATLEAKQKQDEADELQSLAKALTAERDQYRNMYEAISNATFWKMTKPMRQFAGFVKRFIKRIPVLRLFYKFLFSLRYFGINGTWRKIKERTKRKKNAREAVAAAILNKAEITRQRNQKFKRDIKISVIVPLYNTPKIFLREMILSVIGQTYANWELCMADGSDSKHKYVKKICTGFGKRDKRILYKKLAQNEGISANTNQAAEMATGNYLALLDHDDVLHPAAFFEAVTAICEKNADLVYTDKGTFIKHPSEANLLHFKPDYAPDTLRANNYICHLNVFSAELFNEAGKFEPALDGSQDHDMMLRLTEKAKKIVHIPKVLYFWRAHPKSTAFDIESKHYALEAGRKAVKNHLDRIGLKGEVEIIKHMPGAYRIRYKITGAPLVSIIIPNKDESETLKKCLRSIQEYSTYLNYEIIIVENGSKQPATFKYYTSIENEKIKVVKWDGEFNFSLIINHGASFATGEYYILLNNDTEIISPNWIEEMLMYAQRGDVGAVGAKLYYPDNTIQHAGVILGMGGTAAHLCKGFMKNEPGYMFRLSIVQNLSIVTGACMMVPKKVFHSVGGFDKYFGVAYNDVDFCMKTRKKGYSVVFTPYAEAYHYESKSRGYEDTPEKMERYQREFELFRNKWAYEIEQGDPYYNPNFSLDRDDFFVG